MNWVGSTSDPPVPNVSCWPLVEYTVLMPLLPVALLGVLVKTKSLKFVGANPLEFVVCAATVAAKVRSPARLGRSRIRFIRVSLLLSYWLCVCAGAGDRLSDLTRDPVRTVWGRRRKIIR